MESLEDIIKKLPPELKQEVMDFAKYLMEKYSAKKGRKLSLDWAGGLKEYKDKFTSLELQKKSIEWWGD